MTKFITYKCDECRCTLKIEFPDSEDTEFQHSGWVHDCYVSDTHYCKDCAEELNRIE